MGIKLAKALGHNCVAISTSTNKEALAKEKGADAFVVSKDPESIKANMASCDIILNTVAAAHDLSLYLPLLKKNGVLVQLGLVTQPHAIYQLPELIMKRKSVAGSFIGGIAATQEVIDLCFEVGACRTSVCACVHMCKSRVLCVCPTHSVCLAGCLAVWLAGCVSVCVCLAGCWAVCLSVLSGCLSVCLFGCLSVSSRARARTHTHVCVCVCVFGGCLFSRACVCGIARWLE